MVIPDSLPQMIIARELFAVLQSALGVICFCIEALVRLLAATKTITYLKYRTALFSGCDHATNPLNDSWEF